MSLIERLERAQRAAAAVAETADRPADETAASAAAPAVSSNGAAAPVADPGQALVPVVTTAVPVFDTPPEIRSGGLHAIGWASRPSTAGPGPTHPRSSAAPADRGRRGVQGPPGGQGRRRPDHDRAHGGPGGPARWVRRHPRGANGARRRDGPRRHRVRTAGAAARGPDHHRGHGQRARSHLHRAQGQDRTHRHGLPQRPARPARHRTDHRAAGPAHRRVEPARGCPPARRFARQRDHRAALAHRAGHHRPQVLADAVHGRGPHRVRDRDGRDVRVPPRVHRGAAQPVRLGRDRLGQDHDPQRALVVHPERRAHRDDRGRRRAPAPPGPRHHAGGPAAQPGG